MSNIQHPASNDSTYDTIVIGAGMSGLAAGIRLAHFGQRVCLLERHSAIGGLNSFYRQRGRNYDVGLHALTNFTPKGTRGGPLARLLRQLRIAWDEFALVEQRGSAIRFPGATLRFNNDFELLLSEVRDRFPGEEDGLRRLVERLITYEELGGAAVDVSARDMLRELIREPLLREMLICPLLFYGGPSAHDMDFGHFSVLFRSIYLEGLARPIAGVRVILRKLVQRFRSLGGELRLRAGVRRLVVAGDRVESVELEDGSVLHAKKVLSSAGLPETMRLCGSKYVTDTASLGDLSFVEAIAVLDRQPKDLGHEHTIVFFNDSPEFEYRSPDELTDLRSGVICSPNNFVYEQPPAEGVIRITALANYDRWAALEPDAYRAEKARWYERMAASAVRFAPDFRPAVIDTDMFTPTTIYRYTGREKGAVYGVSRKRFDGRTPLSNLYLCGTDQGMVGIVGTLVSGIAVANRHLLKR